MRRWTLVLLVLPGCAAIATTPGRTAGRGCSRSGNPAGAILKFVFNVGAPFDLPFSLAVDTLLLPLTCTVALVDAASGIGSSDIFAERAERLDELDALLAERPTAPLLVERAGLRALAGDPRGARENLERALELEPDHPGALFARGDLLHRGGDPVGARLDLDRAIELAPRHVWAHVVRGDARLDLGDVSGTIADWSRAEELAAGTHEAAWLPSVLRERSEGSAWQELILRRLPHRRPR